MSRLPNFCPTCGSSLEDVHKFGALRRVCPACGYVHFNDPKVAVVTFITQENRVLLVKRGVEPEAGKWALPAGYVDYGEDPRETAFRETREETGLEIAIIGLFDVMFYRGNNAVIVIIYEGQAIGGQLQAGDDAIEARWFTPVELPELAFESTHAVIVAWIERLKQAPSTTQ